MKPAQRKLLWFRSDKKYINRLYRIGVFDEGYDTSCNTVTVSHSPLELQTKVREETIVRAFTVIMKYSGTFI